MPREQINFPDITQAGTETDFIGPVVHVAWGDGNVQLAFESTQRTLRFALDSCTTSDSTPTIFTPEFDRREINKLIRVLRTARDKAYGRDE